MASNQVLWCPQLATPPTSSLWSAPVCPWVCLLHKSSPTPPPTPPTNQIITQNDFSLLKREVEGLTLILGNVNNILLLYQVWIISWVKTYTDHISSISWFSNINLLSNLFYWIRFVNSSKRYKGNLLQLERHE